MSALASCMAPVSEQGSAAQPAAERPHYASPSTLKSSSTLRSTSDTAGALPGPATHALLSRSVLWQVTPAFRRFEKHDLHNESRYFQKEISMSVNAGDALKMGNVMNAIDGSTWEFATSV